MKIWTFLPPEYIHLNVDAPDKDATLRFASDIFARNAAVKSADALYKGMKMREDMMSTGIGNGIAIPHTSSAEAENAAVVLMRLLQAIDFEALDAQPVDVVIGLIVPSNGESLHLQLLGGLSKLCHNPRFLSSIRTARDASSLQEAIKDLEEQLQ